MSNAECVKRWQQKQKQRLEDAEAEVARLRSLDHAQILADSAARKLLAEGAENYVGDVFTITVDNGEAFEIVVTTQRVGAKSPHELHAEANAKLEYATQLLRDIEARLQSGDTDFPSLGYDIECRMHEVLHDKP